MSKATTINGKLKKPRPDFPLTPRGDQRWQKKHGGRVYYFRGSAKEAEAEWNRVKADIYGGFDPRPATEQVTVKYLVNSFLTDKQHEVDQGELTKRSWRDYNAACGLVIAGLGRTRVVDSLSIDDFKALRRHLAKGRSLSTLSNLVTRARMLFTHAYDSGLIERPLRGIKKGLKPPKKDALRKEKARKKEQNGDNLFTRKQIHALLEAASLQVRAMVLLGINCGLGNADVSQLEARHIQDAWLNFARAKTGVNRRCKLWPETLKAIDDAGLPFRYRGGPWVSSETSQNDKLAKVFRQLLNGIGVTQRGLGFYVLRHVHRTVSDEVGDRRAADCVMGHLDPTVASHYVEKVSDARLEAISDRLHVWLFGENETE